MKDHKDHRLILAGDVGGTKTNLGIFAGGKSRPILKIMETYDSRKASGLEDIIERFMNEYAAPLAGACFGIAGPVVDGRSKTTNLPWVVSEGQLKRRFKWPHVRLINDLTATAQAVPFLNRRELHFLNSVRARKSRNIALVAPGTGLGEALLIFQKGKFIPIPSEGGHADFSPKNEEEIQLWRYVHKLFGHVSIERLLSGTGLFNIYSWLKDSGQYKEPAWLRKNIKEQEPAKAIIEAAMAKKHPLCVASLNRFVSIFGSVAGNLALTGMTTGGVYLGGGIPPRIIAKLEEDIFMKAFTDKGRFKGFMERIPVRVILNDRTALMGAASVGLEIVKQK